METGVLSQVVLPLAIALIMVAMGMSLVVDDFRRLASEPRAVLTGLGCQLVVLPALAAGFLIARAAGLGRSQAVTIGIETGLQNATLAIAIALSILDSAEMAIVPGLYGVWMLVTGFAFALWLRPARAPERA